MKKVISITFSLLGIVAVVGVLFNYQIVRQQVSAQESAEKSLIVEGKNAALPSDADGEKSEKFDRLIEKARNVGAARVIIRLKTDFAPEGNLSFARQSNQRAEIRRAQENLIGRLKKITVNDVKQYNYIPYVAFSADAETLEKIKNSPDVEAIYEDALFEPTLAESTLIIGAPGGISNGFSGSGQSVAILDTGVDKNHIFFSGGKVVSEACYSTTDPTENSTSVCPGGASSSTASDSGLNCPDATVGCYHGTHVAGIAAGRDVAGNRFGVARNANVIAIQIFSSFAPSRCGGVSSCALSYTSDLLRGLERVYELESTDPTINVASANLSLGGGNFTVNCDSDNEFAGIKAAIDNLRSINVATAAASGNNYYTAAMNAPGCISTAISVGSTTDTTDAVSAFSNSADFLNLLAPGQTINSSMPGANNFANLSGTSMATPHVAGAWAILKEQNSNATVSEILTALTSTGKIITDTRSGAGDRKTPRIRVDAALRQLAGSDCVRTPTSTNQIVNTTLDVGDCALETGVNRDLYAFNGTAGGKITILMSSGDFNTYLFLLDPNGKVIAFDDDSGGGTNARIPAVGSITLPVTGSYTIIATKSGTSFQGDAPQNGNYAINVFGPTAAFAVVAGQVVLPDELGLRNASVTLTDSQGNSRTISTGKNGSFLFGNVSVGETYILSVASKRYTYAPQVVTVTGDLTNLNFTALQ